MIGSLHVLRCRWTNIPIASYNLSSGLSCDGRNALLCRVATSGASMRQNISGYLDVGVIKRQPSRGSSAPIFFSLAPTHISVPYYLDTSLPGGQHQSYICQNTRKPQVFSSGSLNGYPHLSNFKSNHKLTPGKENASRNLTNLDVFYRHTYIQELAHRGNHSDLFGQPSPKSCDASGTHSKLNISLERDPVLKVDGRLKRGSPSGRGPLRKRDPEDLPHPTDLSIIFCKLREELPDFFEGHHSFAMYDRNMIFQTNLFPLQTQLRSLKRYRRLITLLRNSARMLLASPRLDLLKITKDNDMGTISARWRVCGLQRIVPFAKESVLFDGFSTFEVNSEGLISKHQLDKIVPSKEAEIGDPNLLNEPC